MIIDGKFINEKLQCAIDREAAKVSALSLSKIDKYEYLSGEAILPPNKNRVIEHYLLSFRKSFRKQTKKHIDAFDYVYKKQVR